MKTINELLDQIRERLPEQDKHLAKELTLLLLEDGKMEINVDIVPTPHRSPMRGSFLERMKKA